jgi:hypothetical protein
MKFSASATAPATQAVRFPDERKKNQPELSESTAQQPATDALHNKIQVRCCRLGCCSSARIHTLWL